MVKIQRTVCCSECSTKYLQTNGSFQLLIRSSFLTLEESIQDLLKTLNQGYYFCVGPPSGFLVSSFFYKINDEGPCNHCKKITQKTYGESKIFWKRSNKRLHLKLLFGNQQLKFPVGQFIALRVNNSTLWMKFFAARCENTVIQRTYHDRFLVITNPKPRRSHGYNITKDKIYQRNDISELIYERITKNSFYHHIFLMTCGFEGSGLPPYCLLRVVDFLYPDEEISHIHKITPIVTFRKAANAIYKARRRKETELFGGSGKFELILKRNGSNLGLYSMSTLCSL